MKKALLAMQAEEKIAGITTIGDRRIYMMERVREEDMYESPKKH